MNFRKRVFRSFTEVAMEPAPDSSVPIQLPQEEIERAFDELGMPKFLNNTCLLKKLDTQKSTSGVELQLPMVYYFGHHRRLRAAWRKEKFVRKSDSTTQAIVYWRKLANGEEERRVQQFTSPDGRFFAVDSIRRCWE